MLSDLFARKTELVQAILISFEDVKDDIESSLRQTKSRELALQAAKTLVENIQKGQTPVSASIKQKKNISRQGGIPELGMNQKLTKSLHKWIE